MGKVLEFLKGNLVVVVSIVLILAVLPTGYIFSSKWNKKVFDKADAAYKDEKRKLDRAGQISYSLPSVLDGEEELSESRAPNKAVTEFYAGHKEQREEQVEEVVARGTAFNQGDHVQLVPGILPKAKDQRALRALARDMAEAVVGTESKPSVYQRKLQRLNAGSPPDSESLALTLNELMNREEQRYSNSNADGNISIAQSEQLGKDLVARRLGEYIGRSKGLTFYCTTDAFVDGKAKGTGRGTADSGLSAYSVVPAVVPPSSTIDESLVFTWLWDFWIISDVLDAVALANTDYQTGAMSIPDSPVKRVEQIRISELELGEEVEDTSGSSSTRGRGGSTSTATKDDVYATFTGREMGESNAAFDIRMIEMVVVASSQDLPKFIDAIGKSNYMTVTDVDLEQVDVWSDLEEGFYYGEDHVVRASISIESVWLRSWMAPMMPDRVKTALGVPVEVDLEDSEG